MSELSENDRNDSNYSPLPIANKPKTLLTQEFNTIPVNTSSTISTTQATNHSSNSNNTRSLEGTFNILNTFNSSPSLPFVIGNNTFSDLNVSNVMGITPPSFIYHPIQIPTISHDQMQQFFNGKRVKLDDRCTDSKMSDKSVVEELASFKNSLKSSFDANLQKLEVLDRLVQTVNFKGNFQFGALKSSLDILICSRGLLKDLIGEQVKETAEIIFELKNSLIPEITEAIKTAPVTKGELFDKLRKEEDTHLTDLTILSTRNKTLQNDSRILKEQHDRLQTEFNESLKLSAIEKEESQLFIQQISQILQVTEGDKNVLLDEIEDLFKENEIKSGFYKEMKNGFYKEISKLKETIDHIKTETENVFAVNETETVYNLFEECVDEVIKLQGDGLVNGFEEILHSRERFYNQTLNNLSRRFEDLLEIQNQLSHQSLKVKMSLQGQLADSLENCGRLRQHCQQLTVNLNSASADLDNKRILLQRSDSELEDQRKKFEERIRQLELDISIKNQENRDLGIKNQELQVELDENLTRHRHDTAALERKISILESKILTKTSINNDNNNNNNNINNGQHAHNIDPLSSLGRRDSLNANEDISVIPPTCLPKPSLNFIITFTGIRDALKQKEYSNWLKELGANVHVGPDFNDDITHVLAPRGYKSIRILAASLTGKWIVNSDWLEACHSSKEFVSELKYGGYCNTTIRPFRFRTLWMSSAFTTTHKNHPTYPTAALKTLLEKLGKARWCDSRNQADFLIVTEEEKVGKLVESSSKGTILTLNTLLSMIPIE